MNNLINNKIINKELMNNKSLNLINYHLNDFDKLKESLSEILYQNDKTNIVDYLYYFNNLYKEVSNNIKELEELEKDKKYYIEIIKEQSDFNKLEEKDIKKQLNELEKSKNNLNLNLNNKNNHFEILKNENELLSLKNKINSLELKLKKYNENEKIINESIHNFTMDNNYLSNINNKFINLKKIIKWILLEFNINENYVYYNKHSRIINYLINIIFD